MPNPDNAATDDALLEESLVLNPTLNLHFSVTRIESGTHVRRLYFHWPTTPTPTREDFALMRALLDLGESALHGPTEAMVPEAMVEKLLAQGLVVPETAAMEHEVRPVLQLSSTEAALLPAYPGCEARPEPPDDVLVDAFVRSDPAADGPVSAPVWLADPVTGLRLPFTEGTDPQGMGTEARAALGLAIGEAGLAARRSEWAASLRSGAAELAERGFVVLRRFLAPWQIAALRAYARDCAGHGLLMCREDQVRGRYQQHNNPVLQTIHRQLPAMLRRVLPEEVKPSFSFLALYPHNTALVRHLDRASCIWNISLVLDCDREVPLAQSWPLWLEPERGGVFDVKLELGDIVVYAGRTTWHWRHPLLNGQRYVSGGFFHFVGTDYEGSLD